MRAGRWYSPPRATLGDFLDKPLAHGGLALSRYSASAVLAFFMLACILLLPQRGRRSVPVIDPKRKWK